MRFTARFVWLCLGVCACGTQERIVFSDKTLALAGTEAQVTVGDGLELRHLATVEPPRTTRGERTQAAGFDSDGLGRFYVAYNSMGASSYGALEVLEGRCRGEGDLRVAASRVFDDYEFAAVRRHRGVMVAVGAKRGVGAILVVAEQRGNRIELRSELPLLPAYYATSLSIDGDRAYVSTGDNDGVRVVELRDLDTPTVVGFWPLQNATWTERAFGTTLALGGEASTGLYREAGGALTLSLPVADGVLPAPNRLAREGDLGVLNGGGLTVVRFGANFASTGAVDVLGRRSLPGTSNGVALDTGRRVYAAQGEAGLHVYDVCDPTDPVALGRVDFPDDSGSANDVHYAHMAAGNDDNDGVLEDAHGSDVQRVVLLADGLGGFKVLTLRLGTQSRVSLESSKTYNPSNWQNGRVVVSAPASYRVPASIDVSAGNAGNHRCELFFDDVKCTYQGGSSQAHPAGATQTALGLRYTLRECSNGARAGDAVAARCRVTLRIDNGDSYQAETRVHTELERAD